MVDTVSVSTISLWCKYVLYIAWCCCKQIALQCPKMMFALEKSMMISLIQSLSENQYVCNNLIWQIYAPCDKVSHVLREPLLYRTSQYITTYHNPDFWLIKTIDLNINSYNLFLILLFQLTWSGSGTIESNPVLIWFLRSFWQSTHWVHLFETSYRGVPYGRRRF